MTGNDRRLDLWGQLGVRTWRDMRGTVLQVVGEVDLATEARFHTALEHALENRPDALVADLTGVTFLGSVGVRHLIAVDAAVGSGVMRVVPSPTARRAIEVTGLGGVLTLRSTVDEALDAR
jgi:anti-sigma B factor antagonist